MMVMVMRRYARVTEVWAHTHVGNVMKEWFASGRSCKFMSNVAASMCVKGRNLEVYT